MNPLLTRLHPYPFERLKALTRDLVPNPALKPIGLGIGEPRHPTPELIKRAIVDNLKGLESYPATAGDPALRSAIAGWVQRRYGVTVDPATEVLPVGGSREALFALAQTVIDPTRPGATVVCPNPFYQIYEGAALLAGAEVAYANSDPDRNFAVDWASVPEATWARTQLVYVCSPGNPTGAVMPLEEWQRLFELSDRHGFVIASDECYSEIYFRDEPPLGSLEAAARLGRGHQRLVALTSLSKRSNVPGMRSGFVAGDAAILKQFLLYRTYHGSAMNPVVQQASIAAWNDEAHVVANRDKYRRKFAQVTPVLAEGHAGGAARCRVLPLGRRLGRSPRRRRCRVRAGPARSIQCRGVARQPAGASRARRQPGRRPNPPGARRRSRGMPRSRAPHRLLHPVQQSPLMTESSTHEKQSLIELAWEGRASINATNSPEIYAAVESVIADLDAGRLRVAERQGVGQWTVNQWVKKAVLLSFRLNDNKAIQAGELGFYDKVPTKFAGMDEAAMRATGVRVVPPAVARRGAYIAKNVVLMPSYVNIGAYVDESTMVDTWATVGSCAQIGKNVHLSGGVGIGGVLEPLQANPTIIEDNCFIGARSEVVEGVIVEENSVISMGVYISQSTKIYNRMTGEVSYGRIPSGSVVVSGSLPAVDGSHSLYCAVIVKRVTAETRAKTSINELLRS